MIKLCLLSGCSLSDCIDIYKRNLFHYIALQNGNHHIMFEVILRCYKLEFQNKINDLYSFMGKSFLKITDSTESLSDSQVISLLEEMSIKSIAEKELNNIEYKSISSVLNQQDVEGKTPLHIACERSNFEVVKLLLHYNANTIIRDNKENVKSS